MSARLEKSLAAARQLADWLKARPQQWRLLFEPELDLVVWAPRAARASQVSRLSQAIFEKAAAHDLHLAITQVSEGLVWPELEWDVPRVACLRSCLMKPEHLEWMPEICRRLELASS
ncbi:MAG: hypothetical protein U0931_20425 [Vulcanimicrobiota bacterium]